MGRRNVDWDPIRRDFEADQLSGDELATKHGVDRASIYRKAKKAGWRKNLAHQVQERTQAMLVEATVSGSAQGTPKATKQLRKAENLGKPQAASQPATGTQDHAQGTPGHPGNTPSDATSVELAARANVEVILGHRRSLVRAQRITERLFEEAEAQFADATEVLPMLRSASITVAGKPLTSRQLDSVVTALARAKDLPTRASTIKTLTEAMRLQQQLERQAFGIDKGDGGAGDDNIDFRQRMLNARERALSTRTAS